MHSGSIETPIQENEFQEILAEWIATIDDLSNIDISNIDDFSSSNIKAIKEKIDLYYTLFLKLDPNERTTLQSEKIEVAYAPYASFNVRLFEDKVNELYEPVFNAGHVEAGGFHDPVFNAEYFELFFDDGEIPKHIDRMDELTAQLCDYPQRMDPLEQESVLNAINEYNTIWTKLLRSTDITLSEEQKKICQSISLKRNGFRMPKFMTKEEELKLEDELPVFGDESSISSSRTSTSPHSIDLSFEQDSLSDVFFPETPPNNDVSYYVSDTGENSSTHTPSGIPLGKEEPFSWSVSSSTSGLVKSASPKLSFPGNNKKITPQVVNIDHKRDSSTQRPTITREKLSDILKSYKTTSRFYAFFLSCFGFSDKRSGTIVVLFMLLDNEKNRNKTHFTQVDIENKINAIYNDDRHVRHRLGLFSGHCNEKENGSGTDKVLVELRNAFQPK